MLLIAFLAGAFVLALGILIGATLAQLNLNKTKIIKE